MKKALVIIVLQIVTYNVLFAQAKNADSDTTKTIKLTEYQKAKLQVYKNQQKQLQAQFDKVSRNIDSLYMEDIKLIVDGNTPLVEVEKLLSVTDSTIVLQKRKKEVLNKDNKK